MDEQTSKYKWTNKQLSDAYLNDYIYLLFELGIVVYELRTKLKNKIIFLLLYQKQIKCVQKFFYMEIYL